jgi:type VI secretion system protein ImpG
MSERLLDYYERELAYLRSAGQAFARRHPKVAERLELSADESPDPHVERLIESFAFLAARIHQNIDDSTSDVANNLLEQLYPHAVRPLPSATIARFDAGRAKINLAAGYTVARGTPLFTHSSEGDTIYFKTSLPVELWPLKVLSADLQTQDLAPLTGLAEARSVLRLRIAYPAGFGANGAKPGKLRFYIQGGSDSAAQLCDLLLGRTRLVEWHAGERAPQRLAGLPGLVGLEPDEALLPERADTHAALRLLLEYFAFPAKFQFFELDCSALDFPTAATAPAQGTDAEGELRFIFDRKPAGQVLLDAESIQLGCTPVVNLFERTAEPLRITGRQASYTLVADHHRLRATEIYSIERVLCPGMGLPHDELPGYFSSGYKSAAGASWYARRVSGKGEANDMQLTLVDPDFAPARQAATRTLTAKVLCTNAQLARQLGASAELSIEDAGPIATIVVLHKPTEQIQPSLDGAARWKLVSLLSLNQFSLVDGPQARTRLQQLLLLNNLTGALAADSQVRGLTALSCRRVTRYMDAALDPWHGYRQGYSVRIQLDADHFRGSSQMLFCAVLHRFLALFASINTFVELVLEDELGKTLQTWQPLPSKHLSL